MHVALLTSSFDYRNSACDETDVGHDGQDCDGDFLVVKLWELVNIQVQILLNPELDPGPFLLNNQDLVFGGVVLVNVEVVIMSSFGINKHRGNWLTFARVSFPVLYADVVQSEFATIRGFNHERANIIRAAQLPLPLALPVLY